LLAPAKSALVARASAAPALVALAARAAAGTAAAPGERRMPRIPPRCRSAQRRVEVPQSPPRTLSGGCKEKGRARRARPLALDETSLLAAEERQDVLHGGVGYGERLDAELLLHLQRLQLGGFLFHVGVDHL